MLSCITVATCSCWSVRCDMEEKKDEEESTLNEGEADVAIAHAKRLVQSGVQASDIGIITPYAAQVLTCPFPCCKH